MKTNSSDIENLIMKSVAKIKEAQDIDELTNKELIHAISTALPEIMDMHVNNYFKSLTDKYPKLHY